MASRSPSTPPHRDGLSRRGFIGRTGAVVAGTAAASAPLDTARAAPQSAPAQQGENLVAVALTVNGRSVRLMADPRWTLLDTLRERLSLTGTKKGCDRGQCGACTVHVEGRRVLSCLTLTASVDGEHVTTVEGLSDGEHLHPMQRAFIAHDGFQCGYCTSGQIMSAVALVGEGHADTDDDIKEYMSGNICRCGAYPFIRDAIKDAREEMR
ncbi:(2Fe-2S)-binding protein [Actinacidiphila guanduensis]|uniref:Xanthine dehydrogenase YagT iron-sulfur-binding subunit n=1 Tax=Actinacidiphila guanduensis TaxID=310781 RepID=A0A1G9ZI34_9ACTN|nr:(2Fe-2S)-binding protein [Actinacidiphila guanduensis]SDN20959.1 xanthine dehydrogenase YagT iron-sulfur-binding subunit [Actinacidiphila guanduensis]